MPLSFAYLIDFIIHKTAVILYKFAVGTNFICVKFVIKGNKCAKISPVERYAVFSPHTIAEDWGHKNIVDSIENGERREIGQQKRPPMGIQHKAANKDAGKKEF